jgi:hypothetical protein
MAAPDYAAAGLPRPSAAKPFRNYPQPPPQQAPQAGEEAAEDEGEDEEPELLAAAPVVASAAGAATLGELVIWLYAPTALSADVWSGWFSELAAHRVNVTGVAPCSYFVSGDGSFTSQMSNASTAALAFDWTRRFANELGLATNPLIAASGSGMNALIRAGNEANASAFIAQTVAELVALNGSGYNVQLEEPGSPEIEAEWKVFLGKWADALAAAGNKTIALILGSDCRSRDWMYMDCGDYRLLQQNHSNIRGITEATYTKEPSAWIDYAENIVRGLGNPVAQLGLEFGPPLLNHNNGALPKARELGVTTIWVRTRRSFASSPARQSSKPCILSLSSDALAGLGVGERAEYVGRQLGELRVVGKWRVRASSIESLYVYAADDDAVGAPHHRGAQPRLDGGDERVRVGGAEARAAALAAAAASAAAPEGTAQPLEHDAEVARLHHVLAHGNEDPLGRLRRGGGGNCQRRVTVSFGGLRCKTAGALGHACWRGHGY